MGSFVTYPEETSRWFEYINPNNWLLAIGCPYRRTELGAAWVEIGIAWCQFPLLAFVYGLARLVDTCLPAGEYSRFKGRFLSRAAFRKTLVGVILSSYEPIIENAAELVSCQKIPGLQFTRVSKHPEIVCEKHVWSRVLSGFMLLYGVVLPIVLFVCISRYHKKHPITGPKAVGSGGNGHGDGNENGQGGNKSDDHAEVDVLRLSFPDLIGYTLSHHFVVCTTFVVCCFALLNDTGMMRCCDAMM